MFELSANVHYFLYKVKQVKEKRKEKLQHL